MSLVQTSTPKDALIEKTNCETYAQLIICASKRVLFLFILV